MSHDHLGHYDDDLPSDWVMPLPSSDWHYAWMRGSAKSHAAASWAPVLAKENDGMFMRRGHRGFVKRRGLTLMKIKRPL